jgi:ubiquinone/menaquinone biosynthesis C-methylase UbiE
MMDQEIQLPVYSEMLGRLQDRIARLPGALIDTACGSGHMLSMFRERFDQNRPLVGVDLSPRMVAITGERLGTGVPVVRGDMRDLSMIETDSAAVIVNFFALHHLDPKGVKIAASEWHRVLRAGGQLVVAAWEGTGPIDYGDSSDIVALRYTSSELASWFEQVGFSVQRCVVEAVENFPMDAIYLECCKEGR